MPAAKKSVRAKSSARAAAARRPAVKKPVAAPAPAPLPPAKAAVPATKPVAAAKPDKPRKNKLLRDSFTIPKSEYAMLDTLKQRAAKAGRPAKKSEVLRAGVKALAAMGDTAFLAALGAVPAIKTGRPAKA